MAAMADDDGGADPNAPSSEGAAPSPPASSSGAIVDHADAEKSASGEGARDSHDEAQDPPPDAAAEADNNVGAAAAAAADAVSPLAVADASGDANAGESPSLVVPTANGAETAAGGAAREVEAAPQLPMNLANVARLDDADAADALDNEFLSLLPRSILPRIDKLKSLNDQRDEILEEYRVERAALELKFSKRIGPLFEERRAVVNGDLDDAIDKENSEREDDEGEAGEGATEGGVVEDVDEEVDNEQASGANIKGIPQFWACAMGHVDVIAELIAEADVDCLDHLTDITCTDFPDGLGFELTFHFSPNAFFHNAALTKRYEVPNLLTEDEPILKSVTGSTIDWKKGRSLTYREVTKKQRKKGGPRAGQIRTVTKRERTESFFHFFTPPRMPDLEEVMDEEEADEVEEAFDHDYDVAQSIRGHLIPRAVLWFTGEAMMEDYEDMAEEEEEEILEGEERDGEEEPGQQGQQFTLNPGNDDNPFPPPAAGAGDNPECKQN